MKDDAGNAFPEIGDYALVGNCRTAALVSKEGAVEWMCLPTFSDASIFAAILDRGAGHFAVGPVAEHRIHRRYLPGTNVLETTFETPTGTLRLTDCLVLPVSGNGELYPQHELLRRVECVTGAADVEVSFEPRPDYGRVRPRYARRGKLGWQLVGCPYGATLMSGIDLEHDRAAGRLRGVAKLSAGDVRWLSFAYDENEVSVIPPLGEHAEERLQATVAWWEEWGARCTYGGPYKEAVLRSALALKLLTSATSGAVLAAPTTSLPEVAGGPRNWDYRFCWIRDSALVLHAFLSLGFIEEAEGFLEWLLHATRLTWQRFQVMYDLHGETKLDEHELTHLSGYRGARPVRIGNAAHDQLQLDIYGELMETVVRYVDAGGSLDDVECSMLCGVGQQLLKLWKLPDQGIWETRREPRFHTFSKAMCWVALDRLRGSPGASRCPSTAPAWTAPATRSAPRSRSAATTRSSRAMSATTAARRSMRACCSSRATVIRSPGIRAWKAPTASSRRRSGRTASSTAIRTTPATTASPRRRTRSRPAISGRRSILPMPGTKPRRARSSSGSRGSRTTWGSTPRRSARAAASRSATSPRRSRT